jgi:membrane protease YdiL (CAAX protease family)
MTGAGGQGQDYPLSFAGEAAASPADLAAEFNDPPWDVLAGLGLWLVSILLVFMVPTLIALPYILFRFAGTTNAAQTLVTDPTVLLLSVLGVIPAHVLTFGAAWAIVTNYGKRPFWRALGWSFSPRFGFMLSAGLAVALYIVGSIVAKLIGGEPTDIDILANSSLAVRLLLAVLATTTGPLVEEIVYRGVLYPSLQRRIGMVWAVVLVSFLFVLVHVYQYRNSLGAIAVIALLSISLTLVRARTGKLLPCFIMHMFFNGVVSLTIIFYPYLEQFQKGVEQKPQAGMMLWRMLSIFP